MTTSQTNHAATTPPGPQQSGMSAVGAVGAAVDGLSVRPVTPVIGAEIRGIDLAGPLTAEQVTRLRELLAEHKVLFFHDQALDPASHLALGHRFGKILSFPGVNAEHPDHPGVQIVGSWRPAARREDGGRFTGSWHIDASGLLAAPYASILRAVSIPPVGGDTVWANLAAAYDGLSDELKTRLDGLYVTHDVTEHFRQRGIVYPLLAHPLIRTHPETGEPVLHLTFAQHPQIVGWDPAASAALIGTLKEEATRPEYQVRFSWAPGAVAMWDNRAVHHYAVRDYGDYPRRMERVLVVDHATPFIEELL